MKKFVLIPDSFKGTLSSTEICSIMSNCIKKHYPDAQVVSIPVADGGEGSVDCFLTALGGEKVFLTCKNPYFEDMQGFYGILPDGKTAVIEMACVAGLPLVENRKNPMLTTTYGVGELILDACKHGVKKIIVGLGGSCTNDFGCGAAAAIGVKFFNGKGEEFIPTGGTLSDIERIDLSYMEELLDGIERDARSRGIGCYKVNMDNLAASTTEVFRKMCMECGVHLYVESDAVVFANESYLFVHCEGTKLPEIKLPCKRDVKSLFESDATKPMHTRYISGLFELV
jgi:hypothetical protein